MKTLARGGKGVCCGLVLLVLWIEPTKANDFPIELHEAKR
jgi:hypothetical protein